MHIKKGTSSKLWLSIYLFLVIFAPPLVPKPRFVIGMITMAYLLTRKQNIHKIKKCLFDGCIYIWASGVVLFLIHILLMILVNEFLCGDIVQIEHYTALFNRFLISLIEILPCSTYIILKINRYCYGMDDFLKVVFGAALIETFTVILAVLSPSIKDVFNQISVVVSGSSLTEDRWYTTVRSFGFADTLVDTYGWGTGLIAGLALIYGILKKRIYVILSFVLLMAPLFNARTGVVMYVAALVVVVSYCIVRLDIAKILKLFLCFAIFIVIGMALWEITAEYYPATVGWIESGLKDFTAVIGNDQSDKDVGGFALMLQKESWWELPQFPRNIFGTGHSRYGAEGYSHSDFGYVNDIWAGGLYGCVILYGTNLIFTFHSLLHKQVDICHKIMLGYLCITLFAFNVKGCAYGCNSGLVSYTIIVSYINYYYKNNRQMNIIKILKSFNRRKEYAV